MEPTIEQFLKGSTSWYSKYRNVDYHISFHSYTEGNTFNNYQPHGIWCYYLIIPEQMYPHRWQDFKAGAYMDDIPAFEGVDFHGGITFTESSSYFDRTTGKSWDKTKVGCDYNHLWDLEGGYSDDFDTVTRDAKKTIDQFLMKNPDYLIRCKWSGIWDYQSRFYLSKGGWLIHEDSEIPDGYDLWKPV